MRFNKETFDNYLLKIKNQYFNEDLYLAKAMEEGLLTPPVTRAELTKVLNSEDITKIIKNHH